MTSPIAIDTPLAPPFTPAFAIAEPDLEVADRRRPGRRAAHHSLLPLLRAPGTEPSIDLAGPDAAFEDQAFADDDAADPSALARGILWGLVISVPSWIAVAALCWVLF